MAVKPDLPGSLIGTPTAAQLAAAAALDIAPVRPLASSRIFKAAAVAFAATVGLFALLLAGAILISLKDQAFAAQQDLEYAVIGVAAGGLVFAVLHLFFGRFDVNNSRRRLALFLPLLVFFAGILVHAVFWSLALNDLETFPSPDTNTYAIFAFVMAFVFGFSIYYQFRWLRTLFY